MIRQYVVRYRPATGMSSLCPHRHASIRTAAECQMRKQVSVEKVVFRLDGVRCVPLERDETLELIREVAALAAGRSE